MCERAVSEVVIVVLCALGSYSLLYHDELQNPIIAILEVYCKSAQAAVTQRPTYMISMVCVIIRSCQWCYLLFLSFLFHLFSLSHRLSISRQRAS